MTGLAGRPDHSLIQAMSDRLIHRGPDGSGYFVDQNIALGHRRLSIIDLAGGAQPLGNEDGSIQVVFNGEIYNFLELEKDLVGRGHCFRTRSDTEVLVHLYEEVGERLPEYLNGMFAFAIWDQRKRELFLARDRFGKKPLYYSFAVPGYRICFASELKAITLMPGFQRPVNCRSVANFLALSYVPDPDTIFEDVHKLRGGHSLSLRLDGEPRFRRYWQPGFASDSQLDYRETGEQVRALVSDAVRIRMISDVPLGAFLSGGVDSSSIVAAMARQSSDPIQSFSIGFTVRAFDELEFARMVAERYHTSHHEQTVSMDMHETLGTLVEHYDEPFADASAIPMLYLSRMTREHVTVALCGDGADELFGGYRRYTMGMVEASIRRYLPSWFRQPVFGTLGRVYPKFDYLPRMFRAKMMLTALSQDIADSYFTSMTGFRDQSLRDVLSEELTARLQGYCPRQWFRECFEKVSHLPPLEQLQAVDLETYLPGDILVKADRATMAYSLESRSPLLDYRLAELTFRMPAGWKVRGSTGKYILKQAMAADLPSPILTRAKMGFSPPVGDWMKTSLKPVFESLVFRQEMAAYLSLPAVRRIWLQHQSGLYDHARRLWTLLMLACWDAVWHGSGQAGSQILASCLGRDSRVREAGCRPG